MMKRIAVLTHFYEPEPCAAANRAASLVRALASEGHDVTVVTNFANFPNGKLSPQDARLAYRVEQMGGARVVRLFTRNFRRLPAARLWHWLLSALSSSWFLLTTRSRFDSLIVTMPPITLALPALIGTWWHRAKLVVDVRDVYPDIAIAMGEWPANGFLARSTEYVVQMLYRQAALVTAVTPTALHQIGSRGVKGDHLLLAPNGCDALPEAGPTRARRDQNFVALYAGNLGLATDIDVLLDAAALLRAQEKIAIWVAGDGVEGERLRRRVAEERLLNVRFFGSVARSEAMQLMADADIALVPLRKGINESIPTKMFDALSVGCPVLVAADGEARATALASGGGVVIPPGDAAALADAITTLAALDSWALRKRGSEGRSFVGKFYQRDAIMLDYSRRVAAL